MTTTTAAPAVATYDHDHSTKWVTVYTVPSARITDLAYPVAHDLRLDRWRCPCPANVAECRHIRAARQHEDERWWTRVLADYTAPMLLSLIAERQGDVDVGMADRDDHAALAAARGLLAAHTEGRRR